MEQQSPVNRWLVVVGATLGLVVGTGPVMFYTFGTFVGPITAEFEWNRGTISSALFIGYALAAIAVPISGKLVDRYGVRPVTLAGIALFGLGGIAMSLTPASPAVFLALWGLWGFFSGFQTPLAYARAVSAWFDKSRGIALGLTMCGTGIGAIILPLASRALINSYGWRGAFVGLGVITIVVGIPAVAFLVREAPKRGNTESALSSVGISVGEAFRSPRFWVIGISTLFVVTTILGATAHLVPLLTDRGVSQTLITSALAATGLATIGGRLITGYLVDRFHAPYVAAVTFLIPLVSLILLGTGAGGVGPLIAVVGLGFVTGAEVDLIAFIVTRYFGFRAFGQIYGYLFAVFLFATGFGPYLMGVSFDITSSYNVTLGIFGACLVISAVLIARLGPYLYPATRPTT